MNLRPVRSMLRSTALLLSLWAAAAPHVPGVPWEEGDVTANSRVLSRRGRNHNAWLGCLRELVAPGDVWGPSWPTTSRWWCV